MSVPDDLVLAYTELQKLTRQVEASLQKGVDLNVLTPLFERKAALNEQIRTLGVPTTDWEPEQLKRLLEAQALAAQAEADLVQQLQLIVSSVRTENPWKDASEGRQTGKKWDLSG